MISVLLFEILVVLITIFLLIFMKSKGINNVIRKFGILLLAVLLFQIMAEPMWINSNLHSWAYIYGNVSWVLAFGWVSIFLISFLVVDSIFRKTSEKVKFWLYLLVVTLITVPLESLILNMGIRTYALFLSETFGGFMIPLTQVPIEVLVAVPMISALVIPFYKYFSK
jgi:hypothetical protein